MIHVNLSKICAKLMSKFIDLKMQVSFCKGFNARQCLIYMIEIRWKYFDTDGNGSVLLTELSKYFSCNFHKLLIAKLKGSIVDTNSL